MLRACTLASARGFSFHKHIQSHSRCRDETCMLHGLILVRNSGSETGFSIFELLVSMTIGLGVLAVSLSSTLTVRANYSENIVRGRVQENLRSSLDLISTNIRQAGEGFTGAFPAIEVIDGGGELPDQIILRRKQVIEQPNICANITASSSRTSIAITNTTPSAGCAYSSTSTAYNAWRNFRLDSGGAATAYIYNTSTRLGEFFSYTGESNTGAAYRITPAAGTWENSYAIGNSQLYLLEEWIFSLVNGELKLVQNGESSTPWDVAFGLTNFQVRVALEDGQVLTSFPRGSDWSTIKHLEVTLAAQQEFAGRIISGQMSGQFFPRNVLSN